MWQVPPMLAHEIVKDRMEEDRHRSARRTGETRRPVRPAQEA